MEQNEVTIRTYNGEYLNVVVGNYYGGEGYSGITDGVDVKGKVTKIERQWDSVIIQSEKLKLPCAVKLRSLYPPKN